ncbi:hypothetical protein ACP6L2_03835 [Sphingobacterium lactis]|uniref:hypothetical protein n=1 Tax=Sphingobacterium lactis TaxID=797291 RepID=UPI003F805F3E
MENSCCRGTKRFYKELIKLKKSYPSILLDLKSEFKGYTFIDLFNRNYKLQDAGSQRLIKHRVSNSYNRSGKSGGFRVYYIANLPEEKVTFLTIYPKSNKYGKENLDKNALREIINEYKAENSSKSFVTLDFEEI